MQKSKKSSRFLQIQCEECKNEQIVFSHAKSVIKCHICNHVLAEPTGGKSILHGNVTNVFS